MEALLLRIALSCLKTLSFQEVLDKEKEGNRSSFVDCYTTWGVFLHLSWRKMLLLKTRWPIILMNTLFRSKWIVKKEKAPELAKRFGVPSHLTSLFINGEEKVVNKILRAKAHCIFFSKRVEKGLDPNDSLSAKEKRYVS
ncbi:MAG: hypothetical protein V8S95_04320 [Odoribacter sp.]